MIGAFIKGRLCDRCLLDLSGDIVNIELKNGKTVWGTLRVENTGLEFVYRDKQKDADGHEETSYILYKYEFPNIQTVVRFHDELSEKNKKAREKELERTYHPKWPRRFKRRLLNVFRTVRDSVVEIFNLLISQAKKATPAGKVLSSQDKYVNQMKQELVGSVGASFEPLLERYIGRKVVLEIFKGDKVLEYCGVLKDYTAEFIEIMDVNYAIKQGESIRRADLVIPRKLGLIRHLGE